MKKRFPWLVVVLAAVAVMLLVWEVVFKPGGGEATGVLPTPTRAITPAPTGVTGSARRDVLIKKMPVATDNYTIQYLASQEKFLIMILNNPFEVYQEEVLAWFRTMGVNPESVKIEWGSSRYVVPGKGGVSPTPGIRQ